MIYYDISFELFLLTSHAQNVRHIMISHSFYFFWPKLVIYHDISKFLINHDISINISKKTSPGIITTNCITKYAEANHINFVLANEISTCFGFVTLSHAKHILIYII